jgi:hypothetical protein
MNFRFTITWIAAVVCIAGGGESGRASCQRRNPGNSHRPSQGGRCEYGHKDRKYSRLDHWRGRREELWSLQREEATNVAYTCKNAGKTGKRVILARITPQQSQPNLKGDQWDGQENEYQR